jgi:site-specific DNA-cytosine methylase
LEELAMRVLIACEFSGIVRNAFVAAGHDAMSCDLLPSETERPDGWDGHYQGDVRDLLADPSYAFDLMIAHPPCTHLASSGARWFKDKLADQAEAIEFVRLLAAAPIAKIAIENPIGVLSSRWRKPDQIIQPWQFGHGEVKATCLWLKGLPPLEPTEIVEGRTPRVHYASPGPDRWKERSRTLPGIAAAMAAQWGGVNGPRRSPSRRTAVPHVAATVSAALSR